MKRRKNSKSKHFLPDYTAESVRAIDFEFLKQQGITACFFDLDHTILDRGTAVITGPILEQLNGSGMKVYIATNRRHSEDITKIASQLGAEGVMHSSPGGIFKPRSAYYKRLIKLADVQPEQIAMVGDRIFQDIFGANRSGITSVLVGKMGPLTVIDRVLNVPDKILPRLFSYKYKDV